MKFAEHLSTHLTPEWRKQYINYEKMKKMLYIVCEKAPPVEEPDSELRRRFMVQKEEEFYKYCTDELNKINLFFNQKLAEAQTKFRDLNRDIDILHKIAMVKSKKKSAISTHRSNIGDKIRRGTSAVKGPAKSSDDVNVDKDGRLSMITNLEQGDTSSFSEKNILDAAKTSLDDYRLPKTLRECRSAFAEFYLSLILIQNYQQLNGTGFRKILKKHDKLLQTDSGHKWYVERVSRAPFFVNKEIDNLIANTERIVTEQIEDGNRQAAMKRLRVPPLSEAQSVWTTFRLGFFMGSFLILVFLVILTIFLQERPDEPRWLAVRLFRGFLLLFTNIFLMGVNMYGWQMSGVNHVLIFEIDPRDHLTYQSLMEISAFFATIWALCVLGRITIALGQVGHG
uniref:SPX domain-containing protein n=1 Tax=Romanomermis culicivorax TaxID=13658 RepID=A0A915HIL6_ROMCU